MAKMIVVKQSDLDEKFDHFLKTVEADYMRKAGSVNRQLLEDLFRTVNYHAHDFKKKLED